MTGIGHDYQFRLGKSTVQVPCRRRRTDDIVASLDDDRRNIADLVYILDQIIFGREERVVHEVMTFDAGESETTSAGRRAAIEYYLSVIVPEALGLGAGAAAGAELLYRAPAGELA